MTIIKPIEMSQKTLCFQSWHLVGRIEDKSIWLGFPGFANVFVRCQSGEYLKAACVSIGVKKVAEIATELIVIFIMIPFHGSLLDCAVHPLDLSVRPWMVWLG